MARTPSAPAQTAAPDGALRFSVRNWAFLAAALVCIVVGFALLGGGSTIAAPLLLVLGYVVLIPLGIIL